MGDLQEPQETLGQVHKRAVFKLRLHVLLSVLILAVHVLAVGTTIQSLIALLPAWIGGMAR